MQRGRSSVAQVVWQKWLHITGILNSNEPNRKIGLSKKLLEEKQKVLNLQEKSDFPER